MSFVLPRVSSAGKPRKLTTGKRAVRWKPLNLSGGLDSVLFVTKCPEKMWLPRLVVHH